MPLTDNQAEQDLGMKVACGFLSERGAEDSATLRSVLSAVREQGLNRIETVLRGPDALLARIES